MVRSLLLCALISTTLYAQPNPFPSPTIRNAASNQPGIAPGSFMAISSPTSGFGSNITFNLTTADGVGVQLTPITPPNLSSIASPGGSPITLWFVIPPNARVGSALVTVGPSGAGLNNFIQIVDTAPGLFTANYSGYGPALALNHPSTRNALTSAAVPFGTVSLFATGLNGARTEDVSVELSRQVITPLYAGPQGQPGLDQINFVIPQGAPHGCYVPVRIRVRGVYSNETTISINSDPFACAHPLGLTYSELKTLDAGGSIPLAPFSVTSDATPGQNPVETASIFFPLANASVVAMYAGTQMFAFQTGYCTSGPNTGGAAGVTIATPYDAGSLTLAGPDGKQLEFKHDGFYSGEVPSAQSPFFSAGSWRVTASGGTNLGAFQESFTLPPTLRFENFDNSTVIPSQGYMLNWNPAGFGPDDMMSLTATAAGVNYYYSCVVPARGGSFYLPDIALENFKGKLTSFLTTVTSRNINRPVFSIPSNTGAPVRGFVDYTFTQRVTALVQ